MASGKKNYFRHSFFAATDDKIRELMRHLGKEGYFFFFRLLEMCGQLSAESAQTSFVLHWIVLRTMWETTPKKAKRIVDVLQRVGLCSAKVTDYKVTFELPNFMKYMGYYQTEIKTKPPNIKKGNIKKDNKKKGNINKESYHREKMLLDYWNGAQIVVHEITDDTLRKIKTKLKNRSQYSDDEIKQAVQNYKTARSGSFTHKWAFWDFLQRENADKFYPGQFIPSNFTRKSNAGFTSNFESQMERVDRGEL